MNEQWRIWEPSQNLSQQYYIESVCDYIIDFRIVLIEENKKSKLLMTFKDTVGSYRSIDESYIVNVIENLTKQYGTKFYSRWTFFEIKNSDYLKDLSMKSSTISDYRNFRHFVILTSDIMLDIIALREPEIIIQTI